MLGTMKRHYSVFVLLAAALAWPAAAQTAPVAPASNSPTPAPASVATPGKPALNKGMTGEEIIALIGKPAEVKPMTVGDGKAEVWTYRRLVHTDVRQVATHMEAVPIEAGVSREGKMYETSMQQPVYRQERIQVYQVTALLMFDGKLVRAKQWQEKTSTFD